MSYAVFEDLSALLDEQLGRLDAVTERGVASFNKAIADRQNPAVRTRGRGRQVNI
jgi:hypothetical protein